MTCSLTTVNALTCTERLLRERQRAAAAGLAMRWPAACMMTVLRCMLLAMCLHACGSWITDMGSRQETHNSKEDAVEGWL